MAFSLFTELVALIAIATGVSFVMRLIRQPLLIGYVITGLLVGPFAFELLHSERFFEFFAEIGIAFLLFIVGLNLTPSIIRKFGKVAIIAGLGQVIFTTLAGYGIALLLGLATIPALYIGVSLAFSSTIIIMKLITDRGELESLYSKISIGFLLVQDIVAIALLFIIPILAESSSSLQAISFTLLRGVAAVLAVFGIAYYILPKVHRFISRSQELLFLFSITWGMGFAALFGEIGFSLEAGALLAGVSLSILPSREEIASRLVPLRDFFLLLFFILLGAQMAVANLSSIIVPALVLSALVLVGNPLILMALMGALGYRKKTSFKTGLTVAQISEFSFVLIALGIRIGHLSEELLALVTLVGLITIFGSTYLIIYSDLLFAAFSPILSLFERRKTLEPQAEKKEYTHILLGADRIGHAFIEQLQEEELLVVDYNPDVILHMQEQGIDAQYGDVDDPEFLKTIPLEYARLIISTIPNIHTNKKLLAGLKEHSQKLFIATAPHIEDALTLYKADADYVITPHFLGGEYAASIVANWEKGGSDLPQLRKEHITSLEKRLKSGQVHP